MSEKAVYLVWDGGDEVHVPPPMGTPRNDQMRGTTGERVMELSARICYDSLGAEKSRSTEANLKHLIEVGHTSVAEHYQATVLLRCDIESRDRYAIECLNRPGVWVAFDPKGLRITANARAVMEWMQFPCVRKDFYRRGIGRGLAAVWTQLMPLVVPAPDIPVEFPQFSLVEPKYHEERWVSLYLRGSRGLSHELVRHRFRTGVSQRSTRYVEESDSEWNWHPLLEAYLSEPEVSREDQRHLRLHLGGVQTTCRRAYERVVAELQPWLKARMKARDPDQKYLGIIARKQARGAARGFLGNALRTEMIFSASVGAWRHILRMRAADAADGEIRCLMAEALEVLKGSRYGEFFADMELTEAADGIGKTLKDGGAK